MVQSTVYFERLSPDINLSIEQFSLFSADILQAIGAVMDIKWIHDGKVEVGSFCNAQGGSCSVCFGTKLF